MMIMIICLLGALLQLQLSYKIEHDIHTNRVCILAREVEMEGEYIVYYSSFQCNCKSRTAGFPRHLLPIPIAIYPDSVFQSVDMK